MELAIHRADVHGICITKPLYSELLPKKVKIPCIIVQIAVKGILPVVHYLKDGVLQF